MNIVQYFNTDIRDYSVYACQRAIPSGIDGLKPSQRKVLFGMRKEYPGDAETKVSIASATIMGVSAYHHGSLDGVVVGMAQNFPGSNNLPLLDAIGQFGNRISNVPAASRYIFTRLNKAANSLFVKEDDNILEWLEEDGDKIEPSFYLPILPIVLVNGASGMGTGYSTNILSYKPTDLKDAMKCILKGKKFKKLVPWFNGYTGTIEQGIGNQWVMTGVHEIVNTTTIKITELPVGVTTMAYRDVLNALEDNNTIKSYVDNSTDTKVEFVVTVPRETSRLSSDKIVKLFKLSKKFTENIVVWDENSKLRTFETADDLLVWFTNYRVSRIQDRLDWMIETKSKEKESMDEQIRFIKLYIQQAQEWLKMTYQEIVDRLYQEDFKCPKSLLEIRLSKLTLDAVKSLEKSSADLYDTIEKLKSSVPTDVLITDLQAIKD
jgi:DNA topoisomerase-2